MQAVAGQTFDASLVDQAGIRDLGVRVEVPVTRVIVTAWTPATLSGSLWTVTAASPLVPGDYQLVWMTPDFPPAFEGFVPLIVVAPSAVVDVSFPPVDVPSVTPTVDDVAALEKTRVMTEGGDTKSTFDDTTEVTATDVENLIGQATVNVLSELRPEFDPRHYPTVKHAIALYTAVLIEGSFFRNQDEAQSDTGRSSALWSKLYSNTLSGLQRAIEDDISQAMVLQ